MTKYFLLLLLIIVMPGCKPDKATDNSAEKSLGIDNSADKVIPDGHNSRNSLDWAGVYQGTLPCDQCDGIQTSITLLSMGKFARSIQHLGDNIQSKSDQGNIEWNEAGSKITLISESGARQSYQVGENVLYHLDENGNRMEGDLAERYLLIKNKQDPQLENKAWILKEIRGEKVQVIEDQLEAHIAFLGETGHLSGNDSCNNMLGSYKLMDDDQIELGNIATTMMACPDMSIANEFGKVLSQVSQYQVEDFILRLKDEDSKTLAVFTLQIEK